jgi:hypothetical protein
MSEQEKTTIETIEAAAPLRMSSYPRNPRWTEETAAAEATVEAAPEAAPKPKKKRLRPRRSRGNSRSEGKKGAQEKSRKR